MSHMMVCSFNQVQIFELWDGLNIHDFVCCGTHNLFLYIDPDDGTCAYFCMQPYGFSNTTI